MRPLLLLKRFLKRTKTTQPVVIFDIGSASIGGAVVFFDKEVPHISYCTRIQLPFQEKADEKRLLPQVEEVLAQVADEVQKNGLQPKDGQSIVPQEIVCIFSSLWSNTQATSASFEHKKSFVVTDRIMDNLLAQIHKSNKEEKKGTVKIIEEIIINSVLNGYPTHSPLGKKAQHINVTFLESTITEALYSKIHDVINKVFSPDIPLLLRSFTLASFSVTRDMFEDIRDFLLVDVTGEVTEISVVHDSTLEDTLSFPYGRNTIVRDIAKKTKSVPEDVLARIKIAFTNDKSVSGSSIEDVIFEEEKQWADMFGRACGELSSETKPLPQRVFLISDHNYEDWFRKMIERVDFSQFTATREAFQVEMLIGEKMERTCTFNNKVIPDSFIVVDSLFYGREHLSRGL